MAAAWAARFQPGNESLAIVELVFTAAFLCFVVSHILRYVFRARRVTSEVLFGALSVFLLIGMVFALAFTTLGYGDIGPLTPAARSLVVLEALMGQLFLAVLIARLVALHIVHESEGGGESGVG